MAVLCRKQVLFLSYFDHISTLHAAVESPRKLKFRLYSNFMFDSMQRYYGKSLPLSEDSLQQPGISYLTAEQALADYALLIQHFRTVQYTGITKVIAFGGRYATFGTLSTEGSGYYSPLV